MDVLTLCLQINLQPEIKKCVIDFYDNFNFDIVSKQLKEFLIYEKMKDAQIELQAILGDDVDNIKILTCMLKASADIYDVYKVKGISDNIYFDTMKCYTRFINETYEMTGRLYFDRYWWTTRQSGGHLFRIGALEYEMKHVDDIVVISIHIPSDADFSPSVVDKSLAEAEEFFKRYYSELKNVEYYCHSWLLDRGLQKMLNEKSNIVSFQNRFEIFDEGEVDMEFIEWLFYTKSIDLQKLPEETSLQRNVKKHLLSGGVIRNAYGKLK
ncbi:MAG: DUF5596 domain-containing protein [Lachnospiraceae bacterium]|nr:DUF5596 domain-containing protein [Lachnospiraceae bacterium]